MIIPFLTPEQFQQKLVLVILIQIIIMVCMINLARRNPTDYDTKYTRRWRIINGVFWIIIACSQLFLTQKSFLTPLYYFGVYGTFTPSPDMIATGVTENEIIRDYGQQVIWGHLTFPQWALESQIKNFLTFLSIGLYFIFFRPSSVKIWAKVRKVIGYVLLLFFVPAACDFHYFDVWEFIPAFFVILLVYLCCRSYKRDAVEPKAKETPMSRDGSLIEEFALVEPEEKVVTIPAGDKFGKLSECCSGVKSFFSRKKAHVVLLWVLCAICFVASIVFAVLGSDAEDKERRYRDFCYDFEYCGDYDVYLKEDSWERRNGMGVYEGEYSNVDDNLGIPIHPGKSLRKDYYEYQSSYYGGTYSANHYGQPMYLRCLNYRKNNNLGKSLFAHLQELGYPVIGKINVGTGRSQIIYWDKVKKDIVVKTDIRSVEYDGWIRKHIIEEKDDKVYEFIIYMVDRDTYNDSIEGIYSIDNPGDYTPTSVSSRTWTVWYIIFAILTIILMISVAIVLCRHRGDILNPKAYKLYKYMLSCFIIEYFIHLVVIIPNLPLSRDDYEALFYFIGIFVLYLLLVRIPTLVYAYKKVSQPEGKFYLLPQWAENFVKSYSETEAPLRAALVFLMYPLFYLCTFPAGIFVLLYLIPAIVIYIIVFLLIWVIKGASKEIHQEH